MNGRVFPDIADALRLFRERFFTRTDRVAILAPWGKPCPVDADGVLDDLLRTHVLGREAPEATVRYANRRGKGVMKGRFRVGSYTPATDGTTRWLCVDFDGQGHADALADPESCVRAAYEAFSSRGIPVYIERSGGGHGWHLWCFFNEPVPAKKARKLAFLLLPEDAPLADGGVADPRRARGIEVFPKQNRIRKNGFGNLVWLPWWAGAAENGNTFYRPGPGGGLDPFVPDTLETAGGETIDRVLKEPERDRQKETGKAGTSPAASPAGSWSEWRERALASLSLEAVYGEWLTGRRSGEGWLECRDPDSPSGDRNPSAGVADGTGEAERGSFHSFISGRTISVFDFLVERGRARDFREAARRIADLSGVPLPSTPGGGLSGATTGRRGLPDIQVNNRQLRDIIADAWSAVRRANGTGSPSHRRKPFLFLRSGGLVRLASGEHGPQIEPMDEHAVFGMLARVANWVRLTEEACIDTSPVRDVARDMLAYPDPRLPLLDAVAATPVFGRSGELITRPGYHPSERLWFQPDEDMDCFDVPESPSAPEIEQARSLLLDELLVDFPFVDEADRAHAVAAMILPFVRRMIDGCTPIHLVEAPTAGSGKGLLCNLVSVVVTGRVSDGRTLPAHEDEARKMLTAELAKGRPVILLDNADERKKLDCPSLASVITSESWTDRLLGKTAMVTLPNRALWLLTGNNPRLSLEIARRCVRIRIDPRVDRPWRRSGFRHPLIIEWARQNRVRLVRAVLVLVRAWLAAGRPMHEPRLGSFERWSGVLGGILQVAGIRGFLGSLEDLYEAADVEGQMWREFTAAWWEAFRDEPKKVAELNELCEQQDLMVSVRGDGTPRSQQTRLGKALRSARDRVFEGLRVIRVRMHGRHKGGNCYALVQEDSGPDTGPDTDPGMGTLAGKWGRYGDVADRRPHEASSEITSTCEGDGDVGDFEGGIYARGRTHAHARARITGPNVPNVPMNDVTPCSDRDCSMGTFSGEVPTRSPNVPIDSAELLDLANIPEGDEPEELEPP